MWELVYDHLYDYIGAYMFLALALILFTGLPVAIALGGISTLFLSLIHISSPRDKRQSRMPSSA